MTKEEMQDLLGAFAQIAAEIRVVGRSLERMEGTLKDMAEGLQTRDERLLEGLKQAICRVSE